MATDAKMNSLTRDMEEEINAKEPETAATLHEREQQDDDDYVNRNEATELAEIANRISKNEFPAVLVSEQCSLSECDASDVLAWVQKEESVRIQSYILERYAEFRNAAGQLVEHNEAVFRAQWARDHYYKHLQEYQEANHGNYAVANALKTCMDWTQIPESIRETVLRMAKKIHASQITALIRFIDTQWDEVWLRLPSCAQVDAAGMKRKWILQECGTVLQQFIHKDFETSWAFRPELSVDELPDSEAQQHARKLLSLVQQQHESTIKEAFETEYNKITTLVPASILCGMESAIRKKVLLDKYYAVVERIVHDIPAVTEFSFHPAFPVNDLPSIEDQHHARMLLKQVQSHHVATIEETVAMRYAHTESTIAGSLLQSYQAEIKQNWMREHYYKIIEDVVHEIGNTKQDIPCRSSARLDGSNQGEPTSVSTQGVTNMHVDMLASPRKRVRNSAPSRLDTEVQFKNVLALHTEDFRGSDAIALQALVLYFPDEPRWVGVMNRRTNESENVPVLSLLLADRTGPIILDLWRNVAEDTLRRLEGWTGNDSEHPLLEIRHFVVREMKSCVPRIMKLGSNDRTRVRILASGSQMSWLDEQIEVANSLFTKNFERLTCKLPFQISLAGVVASLQPEVVSQSGNPMRTFKLHDSSGKWILCTAFGRHVDNPCLVDGHEVVLYFATAQAGLNNAAGQLWLYDVAHVMMLRSGCRVPPARTQVMLRDDV